MAQGTSKVGRERKNGEMLGKSLQNHFPLGDLVSSETSELVVAAAAVVRTIISLPV